MSLLRRRLMMAAGGDSSMPDYSDYRGVYIEDVDGYLYTEDEWDGSKTANGIAVLTDNCRFVMALEDAYNSTCQWGDYGIKVSGITTTIEIAEAQADYDGEAQTAIILDQLGDSPENAPAAYYCRAFTYPNGKKGYLGAAGEWQAASDNKAAVMSALSKCGDLKMSMNYWTSTQFGPRDSWESVYGQRLHFTDKDSLRYVRAFAALKSDEWSEEGGGGGFFHC